MKHLSSCVRWRPGLALAFLLALLVLVVAVLLAPGLDELAAWRLLTGRG